MLMEDTIVPDIKIIMSENFSDREVLREVMSGVEEESVPYDVLTSSKDDAVALSYEGSMLSVLEVGIGLDSNGNVSVHSKSLPEDSPLFRINYNIQRDKIRATCSNAARLVKGIPFIL